MQIQNTQRAEGRGKGYVALLITSIFWGTTWVASKFAVKGIPPIQLASVRQLISGLLFVGFFYFFKKQPLPSKRQWRWLFVMALLMFVFANWLSTWGIKYIPTGLAALIGALYPLSVVLIQFFFFNSKKINLLTFLGLFLGIAGVVFVFYQNMYSQISYDLIFGITLSIVAMLSWSVGTIFLSRNKTDINPYYGMGWQMLISSSILFIISYSTRQAIPIADIPVTVWYAIFYLVIFGSVVSFIAFIYSMKILPAAVSSLYAYANPIVAMVTAAIFTEEKMTMSILWGTILTLLGVYLVNYSTKSNQQKIIAEPEQ